MPIDRLVFYALEIFGGMRFGEATGRKWAHYDPGARPLGRIRCATQYDGLELKGGGREREIPVHPVLAALLEEWRTIDFPALFGRAPKPDDWIVPSRLGCVRSVSHMYKKQAEDFERLGLRRRRQHDARRTLRSLCISGGANRGALDAITHSGSSTETGDAPGTYDSWEWPALCEAILCLKIDVTRPHLRGAHSGAHFAEPSAYLLEATHENWRGGRGSKFSSVEAVSNGFVGLELADTSELDSQILRKPGDAGNVGTLGVPTLLELVRSLEAAADAIESGRAVQLTADWRVKLASACRAGASLARERLKAGATAEESDGRPTPPASR